MPVDMRRNAVIYSYPFLVDIVLFLALFVGRHSLAARGLPESTVGSVLLCYGVGYVLANLGVRYVVRPARARAQMVGALVVVFACCLVLARVQAVIAIQAVFCVVPFAVSLFINAFQAFMLGIATDSGRPLAALAGHYTFSWSMGLALGPLLSGAARLRLDWPAIYLLAAALTAALALLVALFEPVRAPARAPDSPAAPAGVTSTHSAPGPDLMGPAWLGVVLGWVAWNAVSTWWAVQAAQAGAGSLTKGGVEFAFAVTQALGALLLIRAGAWHGRATVIPLLGLAGVAGLLLFAAAHNTALFVAAAVLMGLHTASAFSLMLYHAMRDPARAVQRVAVNETVVGLCFLGAPLVASGLRAEGGPFAAGYASLAGLVAIGLLGQGLWARARVASACVDDNDPVCCSKPGKALP